MTYKINFSFLTNEVRSSIKYVSLLVTALCMGFGAHTVFFPNNAPVPCPIVRSNDFTCSVCFTPSQVCLPLVIAEIDLAKTSIHMQAYSMASKPIAEALVRAKARGVSISIIVDKSQQRKFHTHIKDLTHTGIMVYIDYKPSSVHSNKLLIIDAMTTIGGSYNLSNNDENSNPENVTIIKNKEFAALYSDSFQKRLNISRVFSVDAPIKSHPRGRERKRGL